MYAKTFEESYTLYAPTLYTVEDEIIAEGGVVIYNPTSSFSAQKIIYNQKSEILELLGDVYVTYDGVHYIKNEYLKLDLNKDVIRGERLFLYDEKSDLWVKSSTIKSDKKVHKFKNATTSSCDVRDPDWFFTFKRGVYNSDKEYITLNHPKFYLKNTPVFYFPWIAFPTNTKRRSGLLKPYMGFENSENLLFVQPIFIAPYENWDIELSPQIRLDRGMGLYGTLRFVDSDHSYGSVTLGTFDEKTDYAKEHNLKNSTHNGIEVKYQNSAFLSDYFKKYGNYKDGLLIDYTDLSDIDFINLKHDEELAVNKLVTSKLNYSLSNEEHYAGVYAKYFIDTEKLDNDDTLQTLPSIQYHRFTKKLPIEHFLYSLDYKFKNSYRQEGLRARQHEISLPLTYSRPFFDDLINVSISENLYYSRVIYMEGNSTADHANYFSNYHNISVNSDLSKRYDTFIHNMQLGVSYIIPSFDNKNGYFADFIPFNLEQKSVLLKFNEYFYDLEGFNFLSHRIRQNVYLEDEDNSFDDLENELIYRLSNDFYMRNTLVYSHEHNKLKKIQSGLYYNDEYNNLNINHTFQEAPEVEDINFLTADYTRKIDKRYSFFAGVDYDFDDDFTKEWRVGWSMKKRCWDYQIRYKENVTPSLTSGGTESITRRGIYLFVRLANIGGVEVKSVKDYTLENK